jgi:hypothetical protein
MGRRARRRAREKPRLARLGRHGTGDRFGALVEAWVLDGPVAELVALHDAKSPEALQRVLVIPGRRSDTVPDQAVWAFDRAHGDDDSGVVESVVLAVTNHRWTTIARPLLERLTDEGLLDEGHAGQLGLCFLEADVVPVTVPGAWLVDFYVQQRGDDVGRLDPARTYTLARPVSPQVRRWAAGRFARDRDGIARVLRRALRMDSRHAAAAMLGLADASEHLGDADAIEVLEMASDWPAPPVRLAALKLLAARGRHAEALDRAANDRAATIRRWAARRRQACLPAPRQEASQETDSTGKPAPGLPAEPEQPSLFS